jgi:hypothetical protein
MCKKNSICTTILSNLWKVQISEDWYLRGSYSCYLEVFITNKEGKSIQNTLFVNSDDRGLRRCSRKLQS